MNTQQPQETVPKSGDKAHRIRLARPLKVLASLTLLGLSASFATADQASRYGQLHGYGSGYERYDRLDELRERRNYYSERYGLLDRDALDAYAEIAGDEPVTVVNLFKFKSAWHSERFGIGAQLVTIPHLEKIGAQVLYSAPVAGEFNRGQDWDFVTMVQYNSFSDIIATLDDPDVGPAILELRDENLERAQFVVTLPQTP